MSTDPLTRTRLAVVLDGQSRGRPRSSASLCSLAVGLMLCAQAGATAEPLEVNGRAYRKLTQSRGGTYSLTVRLDPPEGQARFERIDLLFAFENEGNHGRFTWGPDGLRVLRLTAGQARALLAEDTPLPPTVASGTTLVLKRRDHWLEVATDRGRVARVLADGLRAGSFATAVGSSYAVAGKTRCQKVAPIAFRDDFMRTIAETEDLGQWRPVTGTWRLHSVMEEVRQNPQAMIREGYEPEAARSVNPFSLSGASPEGALILAGHSFWDDYAVAASVKTTGGQVGLAFGVEAPDRFWLVRWALHSRSIQAGRMDLVQRDGEHERVAATAYVEGRIDNWYRLEARAVGSRIEVLVDGTPVMRLWDRRSVGGRIGLFAKGPDQAFFDDVDVSSWRPVRFDHAEAIRGSGPAVGGPWPTRGGPGDLTFVSPSGRQPDEAGSLYLMGLPMWVGGCATAVVTPAAGAEAFGLVFGAAGHRDHWRAEWRREEGRGELRLTQVSDGTEATLVAAPLSLDPSRPHELRVDLRETERVRVYVDGELELRHVVQATVRGRVGLFARDGGGTTFAHVTAMSEPAEDWERPVNVSVFTDDPFMQGWASPRWAWAPVAGGSPDADGPQIFQHKGDFYGAFRIEVPVRAEAVLFFGLDQVEPGAGYAARVQLQDGRREGAVALSRAGTVLGSTAFDLPAGTTAAKVTVAREGKVIWVEAGAREVLAVREEAPLEGRAVGLVCTGPVDLGSVVVHRNQVKDYRFGRAPVDWNKVGSWEVTNRFFCDPRWSHMNGRSRGVAVLWNKHSFAGDWTLEYYAGMRMRQGDMRDGAAMTFYPRVGDLNAALCADGEDVFSGYSLVIGAWDRLWSERWTQLWRQEKVVEQTDRELIPRTRDGSPVERAIHVEWDPGGRAVHGAWYYVKVRKTGGQFDVSFDNAPVFSYRDDSPLSGQRLALWTQNNSIVIARAVISYEHAAPGGGRLVLPPQPEPSIPPAAAGRPPERRLVCSTHPGRFFDFEQGKDGWRPVDGDQGAELSLAPGGPGRGEHSLRVRNMYGGGSVGVALPLSGLDLARVPCFEMACAIPENVRVNVYFSLRERPGERCFIALSGPDHEEANLLRVDRASGFEADGTWRHVAFDLSRALRTRFPDQRTFVAETVVLGQLHEGYLTAGLGGNKGGSSYLVDNVTFAGIGPGRTELAWPAAGAGVASVKAWRPGGDGTLLQGLPVNGGSFILDLPKTGLWLVRGGGTTAKPAVSPEPVALWVDHPLAVERTTPGPAEAWGGGALTIEFSPNSRALLDPGRLTLTAAGQTIRVDSVSAVYDPRRQTLSVDTGFSDVLFADGATVEFVLTYADNMPPPYLPGPSGGTAAAGHGRRTHRWTARMSFAEDHSPPRPVRLDPAVALRIDFEDGMDGVLPCGNSKLVRARRVRRGAEYALSVANRLCGGRFAITFDVPEFSAGKFPVLAFDYCVSPHVRADLSVRSASGEHVVGFTDNETDKASLGSIPGIVADGQWHRAQCDLGAMVGGAQKRLDPGLFDIRSLAFGDWGYAATPPGVVYAIDNVSSVPLVRTGPDGTTLRWSARDASGVKGYSYAWSREPEAEVDTVPETASMSEVFRDLPEGDLTFHIRAQDGAGNWSEAAHHRFRIDNSPPAVETVEPAPGHGSASPAVTVRFSESVAAIDLPGLTLTLNGTECPLSPAYTSFDSDRRELTWRWVDASRSMNEPIPDGTEMVFGLRGLADFAGNVADDFDWTWHIDYASDRDGPQAPRVVCRTQEVLTYDDFSSGSGAWAAYAPGKSGTEVSVITDPKTHDRCLRIRKTGPGPIFGAHGFQGELDPAEHPLLMFEYRIPKGVRANLLLLVGGAWKAVALTGDETVPEIGRVDGAVADGEWHQAVVRLDEIMRAAFPGKDTLRIQHVAVGNWQGGGNEVGACVYIDNFAIAKPGLPLPEVLFTTADPTGISGLSFGLDRLLHSEPPAQVTSTTRRVTLPVPDAKGLWYVHVRGRDGAGNWGSTARYPYYCEQPAPSEGKEGLEASDRWRVQATGGTAVCSVRSTPSAGGGNALLVLDLRTAAADEVRLQQTSVEALTPGLRLSARLFNQGHRALEVSAFIRLLPRGQQVESGAVTVPAGTWMDEARFDLDLSVFSLTGERSQPPRCYERGLLVRAPARTKASLIVDSLEVGPAD